MNVAIVREVPVMEPGGVEQGRAFTCESAETTKGEQEKAGGKSRRLQGLESEQFYCLVVADCWLPLDVLLSLFCERFWRQLSNSLLNFVRFSWR